MVIVNCLLPSIVVPDPEMVVSDAPDVVLAIFRVPLFVTLLLLVIEPLPDNDIVAPEDTRVDPLKLLTPVNV